MDQVRRYVEVAQECVCGLGPNECRNIIRMCLQFRYGGI
jgi:hypothetical protein